MNRGKSMQEWGRYTVTITEITTGKVVLIKEYFNMSGNAMMDEQYSLHLDYPRSKYKIDW